MILMVNLLFDLQRFAEISNDVIGTLISGTSAADTIYNSGNLVTIKGGAGDDYIQSSTYSNPDLVTALNPYGYGYVTIDAGAGNDTVYSFDPFVSIVGGAGNDFIYNSCYDYVTMSGGTGNDTIELGYGGYNLLKYASGDGNDTVNGFAENSTLSISGASYSSATTSGGDIVVTVGTGKITLEGAASLSSVNIKGTLSGSGSDTTSGGGDDTQSSGSGKILTNRTNSKSISGTAYADELFNYANTVTLKGGKGNDALTTMRKTSGVKLYGEAGDDTLEAYKYMGGDSSVTAIGGAGDDSIEIENSAKALVSVSAAGDGNDLVEGFNSTSSLKIGNGSTDTYYAQKVDDDVIVTVGEGTITLSGAASLWVETLNGGEGGLKNIKGTYVPSILHLDTASPSSVTLGASVLGAEASVRTAAIKIVGNALDNSIIGGSGKDSLYGKAGNDTLDGGKGNDYLHGGAGNDVFVLSAGKDTIADYTEGEDIVYIGGYGDLEIDSSVSGNNGIAKINGSTLTFTNAKFKTVKFVTDNDDFEITFGKETLDNSSDSPHTAGSSIWITDASARTTAMTITGNALDNTITGGSGKDVIKGGDGSDSIYGGKGNDKLYGNGDEDTLWGGAGNDTLIGGEDDDLFVYTGGKDLIYDYVEGEDKISLNAAISDSTINSANVVLKVGSGTLTLRNALFKEVSFINSSGEYTKRFVDEEYDNSSSAKVTLASASKTASADVRTKAITITGNDLNNSILGGSGKDTIYGEDGDDGLMGGKGVDKLYGGDGDDTLIGGLGNDSLWGDEGSNTFVFNAGEGKDLITGFGEDDILQFSGINIDDIIVSKTTSALTFNFDDNNTLTFKKYATDSFNINGTHHEVKGNVLKPIDG